jgi:hypothetical protein
MSEKNYSNNIDEVRAKLARAEACRKAVMRKPTFDKDDGLENEKIQIHPNQLQMHLFPVFKVEVK